jgi:hypothetical protein
MAVIPPLWINALQVNSENLRRDLGGLVLSDTIGSPRTGVLDPRALAITLSGQTVLVGPGPCMIGSTKGGYLTGVDVLTVVRSLTPADATNPRLDRVVLEVLDPDNGSAGTERLARLRVIDGVPAAIPGLPALPALAIHVGQVSVPTSGSGNPVATSNPPLTTTAGSVLQLRTTAERDAIPSTQRWIGLTVAIDALSGSQFRWRGTEWVPTLTTVGIPYTPTWSGAETWGSNFISKGMFWRTGDRVRAQVMIQAGTNASLGRAMIGFSLPTGLPTAADYLSTGPGVHRLSPGGSLKTLVAAAGPGQAAATLWAVPDGVSYMTPGNAGYPWGVGDQFQVSLEYRTSAAI